MGIIHMKRSAAGFSYFLVEGIRSIFLHGFMSFAAVGVIVACLLIMGSFSLVAVNIDSMIRGIEQKNEITLFIDESLTDSEALSVGSSLAIKNVKNAVFVSREKALEQFMEKLEESKKSLFAGYEDTNLIRHRYQVTLMDISLIDETMEELKAIEGVADIRADLKVAQGLATARRIVEAVSAALIIVLLLVSIFIISNTIKLATFDRREEIGIMRIVGATKAFIRWPFVVEGILLGLTASVTGFFAQGGVYTWFTNTILSKIAIVEVIPFSDMLLPIAAAFLLIGFFVGVGGSLLTIRKFLQV